MGKLYRSLKRSLRSMEKTEYEKRTGKTDYKYRFFDLYCAFMDTVVYSWLTPITVVYESLVRVARWLPILWKDRHWDHHFILEILKHKIRFTRECIGKYDRHTTAQSDCIQMKRAEYLLDRLQDPHAYVEKDWDEHWAKWPSDDIFCETRNYREHTEEERKHVKYMMAREEYMWQQDFTYLTKLLRKNIRSWWD